jgi:hypothetical protein
MRLIGSYRERGILPYRKLDQIRTCTFSVWEGGIYPGGVLEESEIVFWNVNWRMVEELVRARR